MTILHPGFRRLRAFAAGELPPAERARVAGHLAGCPRCRRVVASVRALVAAAAEETAPPVPAGAWESILARRAAGEQVILPAADPAPPAAGPARRARSWALPRAAALVLGVAGIASATVLVPTLRPLWERVVGAGPAPAEAGAPSRPSPAAPTVEPAAEPPAGDAVAGMLVAPVDGAVEIRVERPHPELRIRVRTGAGSRVAVRAVGAASTALFRTAPGRVAIVEPGPGEVQVDLPRSVRDAVLSVDGTPYLRQQDGQLRLLVPRADTAGSELVLRVRP